MILSVIFLFQLAIKLDPGSNKAMVHMAKALQGRQDFQKALDILDIALDNCSDSFKDVINKYKLEVIRDMKKSILAD